VASEIQKLKLLAKRIDELEETYELTQRERDRDIRDDLLDLQRRRIEILNEFVISLLTKIARLTREGRG